MKKAAREAIRQAMETVRQSGSGSPDLSHLSLETRKRIWEVGQRKICESKKKYLTEAAALMRGDYYDNESRRTSRSSKKSEAYKCPWCGFFHLTTRSGR